MEKLVRDKVPDVMRASGLIPIVRKASEAEILPLLWNKLREEISELEARPSADEFADVIEVVHRLAKEVGIPLHEVEAVKAQKVASRGAFDENVVLTLPNFSGGREGGK